MGGGGGGRGREKVAWVEALLGGGGDRKGGGGALIVSQPIDIYLNPIKPKYILKSGHSLHFCDLLLKDLFLTPFHFCDLLLKDPFSLPPFFVCGCGCCGCCMGEVVGGFSPVQQLFSILVVSFNSQTLNPFFPLLPFCFFFVLSFFLPILLQLLLFFWLLFHYFVWGRSQTAKDGFKKDLLKRRKKTFSFIMFWKERIGILHQHLHHLQQMQSLLLPCESELQQTC